MKILLICMTSILLGSGVAFADNKQSLEQFDKLDRDGNGLITRDEVKSQPVIIRFMNLYYKDSFSQADINRDGVLDRDELVAHEEIISAE